MVRAILVNRAFLLTLTEDVIISVAHCYKLQLKTLKTN